MSLQPSAVSAVSQSRDALDELMPAMDAYGHVVHPRGPWRDTDAASDTPDRKSLLTAIARLPEPHKTIYRLHDGQGMCKDDLASQPGLPLDEVARVLHRHAAPSSRHSILTSARTPTLLPASEQPAAPPDAAPRTHSMQCM